MKFVRAIVVSLVVYLLTMVIGASVALGIGIELTPGAAVPPMMWYISAFASVVLMAGGAWWFFRWKGTGASFKNGLLLGGTSLLVGFCMDALMLIASGARTDLAQSLLRYYAEPLFLLSLALIVATPAIVGRVQGGR